MSTIHISSHVNENKVLNKVNHIVVRSILLVQTFDLKQ